MTSATHLLLRDFSAHSNTKEPATNENPPPAMYPLLPVADVLITERRFCRACGSIHDAASDKVHRLLSSAAGDPFKRVLRPRKASEVPLPIRCNHIVVVEADHCSCCWETTHFFSTAFEITPEKPKKEHLSIVPSTTLAQALEKARVEAEKKGSKAKYAYMAKLPSKTAAEEL